MNVLDKIPYESQGMGRRKIVDEKYLLVIQIALKPGQSVPQHKANSNVNLLILKGASVTVSLEGVDNQAKEGELLPVKYQTLMTIKNTGNNDVTSLVFKTPNPKEMGKSE